MSQPTNVIQTALLLRIVAILAFPVGVGVAALMERSVLMVAVLAAGMLLVSWVERWRACSLSVLVCSRSFGRPFWRAGWGSPI